MDQVVVWGSKATLADFIAFGALLIAFAAFVVSVIALRLNKNSLSLYEGVDFEGTKLYITNNSPHAVTVSDLGFVGPGGSSRSLLDEWGLKRRIDPRDEVVIAVNDELTAIVRRGKGKFSRHCLFVTLATGHRFYSVSRYRIFAWWIRGWFDGSRRVKY
jgi:hypothetical protein